MNPVIVDTLLKTFQDAVTSLTQQVDITVPIFNPDNKHYSAAMWCLCIEDLGAELGWGSLQQAARASKGLKGSARSWYKFWRPETGRTWENLKKDIIELFPDRKTFTNRLTKAATYKSFTAHTYCGYARAKLRFLRSTKIAFTDAQLVELVCDGVRDVDTTVARTSKTICDLMKIFVMYDEKPKRRYFRNKYNHKSKNRPTLRCNKFRKPDNPLAQRPQRPIYVCTRDNNMKLGETHPLVNGPIIQVLNQDDNKIGLVSNQDMPLPMLENSFIKQQDLN